MTDDLKFDVRLLAHRERRGELSRTQIEKHLAGLPDDAEAGEPTTTVFTASWASRSRDDSAKTAE